MKILLAVDESEDSQRAAQMLIAQATPGETEVLILHVVKILQNQLPEMMLNYEGFELEREAQRHAAEALLENTARALRAKGLRVSTALEWGDPKSEIAATASHWGADLIVLGSHRRHGLDRILSGHVSEAVLRKASCSVEVVRWNQNGSEGR
jgi:nucleotide-binding universal stress UspA family protein